MLPATRRAFDPEGHKGPHVALAPEDPRELRLIYPNQPRELRLAQPGFPMPLTQTCQRGPHNNCLRHKS